MIIGEDSYNPHAILRLCKHENGDIRAIKILLINGDLSSAVWYSEQERDDAFDKANKELDSFARYC